MKRVAFVFPGQGSQTVGMGKEMYDAYPEVQQLVGKADELLQFNLSNLMFEGPVEQLTYTENAQPALLLASAAITKVLEINGVVPVMTAGHSLGEYSALVASGAISIEDALPLVRNRGQLMEQAFPKGQGTMAAVLGMDQESIEAVLIEFNDGTNVVDVANLNCPGQIVISGTTEGIELASEKLKESGAKRVIPLNVSGPFHSSLMKPAAEEFKATLEKVEWKSARVPVYANVTAKPVTNESEIKELLVQQLYSPVRFEETIENMLQHNVDAIVEIGNGKVLTGLIKKISRRTQTFTLQDPESVHAFIDWYKGES